MEGHGGLNILPQKRWNVYNYDNREKVRRDEEAAAREEQLQREAARKRDFESRIEQLRSARGLAPGIRSESELSGPVSESKPTDVHLFEGVEGADASASEPKSGHINLFEGLKVFDIIGGAREDLKDTAKAQRDQPNKKKRRKKEEEMPRVVTAEDEKYRLGYGIAGKGVKLPWYLEKPNDEGDGRGVRGDFDGSRLEIERSGGGRVKKSLQELREERMEREKREKERERALIQVVNHRDGDANHRRIRGVFRC